MKQGVVVTMLILLFLVKGCSVTRVIEGTMAPVDVKVSLTPRTTHLPISATTEYPTATLTPTPAILPLPSSLPLTATPVPTLSAEKAKSLILELLQNNGGCRLPCLWGLTPGETSDWELEAFISQFGSTLGPNVSLHYSNFQNSGGLSLNFWEENLRIDVDLDHHQKNGELERLALFSHSATKETGQKEGQEEYSFGQPYFNQLIQFYMLPQILSNYGRPSQVLIAPFFDEPDYPPAEWLPFDIVLIYKEQGFIVKYVSPKEIIANNYAGCPWKAHVEIYTWSPKREFSLVEVAPEIGGSWIDVSDVESYFKSIEESTSMTLDEFYLKFKDPKNTSCIETPMELWQQP